MIQEILDKLKTKSIEKLNLFLQSYSSKLKETDKHCKDLVDSETGIPYITSS